VPPFSPDVFAESMPAAQARPVQNACVRRFIEAFLSIPGPLAVAAVLVLTAGETALFLGFLIPGELVVILGGVLAARGRAPLLYVVLAGVLGPIIGDSIGYFVGRRYGRRFLDGKRRKRWAKARAWLRRKGASAVFLGRFTAFLRSVVPAAAGVARLPYRRFLPWNVAAGVLWGTGSALLGYFAGRNYEALARKASLWSIGLCVVVAAVIGVVILRRRLRARRRRTTARRKRPR
jgi:membrane-associated protein